MTHARRARVAAAFVLAGMAMLATMAVDAARRRHARERDQPAVLRVVARLPSPDLALAGGARWLRVPSLEEPSAAFDLGPAMLDPDPAGGLIAPPLEVWIEEARRAR